MGVTMRQTVICWLRPMCWPMTVLPGKIMGFLVFPFPVAITCWLNLMLVSFFFSLFREKYAMMFDEPVLLQLGWWYVAWARVSGPSSDCGSHGQATITTDDG